MITVARNTYDEGDHLIESEDVYGDITTYAYDEAGNLTTVSATNDDTSYEYDSMGRRTAVIDAVDELLEDTTIREVDVAV